MQKKEKEQGGPKNGDEFIKMQGKRLMSYKLLYCAFLINLLVLSLLNIQCKFEMELD